MKDLTGQKFGKLTVLEFIERKTQRNGTYRYYWKCRCECGNITTVESYHLKSHHTQSCGCLTKTRNGESKTRLHQIYKAMIRRCYDPKNNRYKYYGQKNIKVCDEWLNDFTTFKKWALSNNYQRELTIDRINENGNYEPNNCRWVNYTVQSRNKSTNINITYNEETHCLKEWAEILNINYKKLYRRTKKLNWSIDRAFNTP